MTIRAAKWADINRIIEVLQDGFARSIYAGRGEIDRKEAHALLTQSIQRHGSPMQAGTLVNVAVTDGKVEGLLLGYLDRVMSIGTMLMATDVWFLGTAKMDARDAFRLLGAFVKWAESNPKVIEIRPTDSAVIGAWKGREQLYRRAGFVPAGVIYERRPACRAS